MNSCLILIILLFCCGNRGDHDRNDKNDCRCDRDCGRDRDRDCGRDRDRDRNDCRESRDNRCFNTFPSPSGTCGCEEKNV